MQRGGDADDARAEDDHVCCRWRHAWVLLESPLLRGAALTWQWGLDLSASLLYTGVGPISVIASEAKQPRPSRSCPLVWIASLSLAMTATPDTFMIPRYSRPEMVAIWAPQTRFKIWFEIEAYACDAMAEIGMIPESAARAIWGKAGHVVLDTCLAVQLRRASDILIADVDALLAALKRRAYEHKLTPTIGRSHGIHAEPTTFGLKLALAYAEFVRARARLVAAREEISTAAISGAVGTFANIDPRVEAYVAAKLDLKPEPISKIG